MSMRWEGDERGHGVADAAWLVPGASELIAAFGASAWVAESPEAHLGPHVEEWCRQDGRLGVIDAHTDDSGVYVLDIEWRDASAGVGPARAAVYGLLGSFAEGATYIRQRRGTNGDDASSNRLQFEVGTGELAPDAMFEPHGHTVLINVVGVL
jgi:hypothetical protein